MNNPFLQDGYLTPSASINKIKIVDKNLYAIDLVSSEVFQKHGIGTVGHNLACLLYDLKRSDGENGVARDGWTEEHWNHWKRTEKIFLAGGITVKPLGETLLKCIDSTFKNMGDAPYKIVIPKHSHLLSLLGAARMAVADKNYKGSAFVFDFGQSYVKRGHVKDVAQKTQITVLDKRQSCYVALDYENAARSKTEAERLDAFVQEVIIDTCKERPCINGSKELLLVLSIANYIYKGGIAGSRGGYGKLCLISNNYEAYLREKLADALKTPVRVKLIHDGMAAAAMIAESQRPYAVITLGTYMGVGFPVSNGEATGFSYELS